MKWVPEWAKSYTISRKACNDASINIYFYESTEYGEKSISELAKDLAINDVCQQIRERNERPKQERYKDATGEDWIDESFRTMTWEEFCGAMKFTIGKYFRRLGKKDDEVMELEKIADYSERWLQKAKNRSIDQHV